MDIVDLVCKLFRNKLTNALTKAWKVLLPALLGKYDRPTDRPINRREVTLSKMCNRKIRSHLSKIPTD